MRNPVRDYASSTFVSALCSLALACGSSDPTGGGGEGTVRLTVWGEEYIEDEIPADEDGGFVDGWSLTYQKFLVNVQNVLAANADGDPAFGAPDSILFDLTEPGKKTLARIDEVPAGSWADFRYEIGPVTEVTERDESASAADLEWMLEQGYSVYFEATAEKGDQEKTLGWGFELGTRYRSCRSEQEGEEQEGIVVENQSTTEVELTIHGDHPFYDRLRASDDPSRSTSLRFEILAVADADDDGEVTLEELDALPLDVTHYDPSGLDAINHGEFVRALVRTLGHFRGEGECTIQRL